MRDFLYAIDFLCNYDVSVCLIETITLEISGKPVLRTLSDLFGGTLWVRLMGYPERTHTVILFKKLWQHVYSPYGQQKKVPLNPFL